MHIQLKCKVHYEAVHLYTDVCCRRRSKILSHHCVEEASNWSWYPIYAACRNPLHYHHEMSRLNGVRRQAVEENQGKWLEHYSLCIYLLELKVALYWLPAQMDEWAWGRNWEHNLTLAHIIHSIHSESARTSCEWWSPLWSSRVGVVIAVLINTIQCSHLQWTRA